MQERLSSKPWPNPEVRLRQLSCEATAAARTLKVSTCCYGAYKSVPAILQFLYVGLFGHVKA